MRAHSKFSASGAERWFNCPGSVELSEGQPDKTSVWAEEGILAHKFLENVLTGNASSKVKNDMYYHVQNAAKFIFDLHRKTKGSELNVETRIYLDFIHPEAFGTFDSGIVDLFGMLHVIDFKYGAGHSVSPVKNLQMIFYGMGLAHKYDWNFKRVRLWIIQPRIKGYDGPTFWDIPIMELKSYVPIYKKAVRQVEQFPNKYVEGEWCWWCKAKSICPLKLKQKQDSCIDIFKSKPL